MLTAAICDDNSTFLREAKAMLQQDHRIGEINIYNHPEDLLHDISSGAKRFDLVLMDIDFDEEETGIQAAGKVCRLCPDTEILYMTAYNDRFSQQILLGDAQPAGYLTKPIAPELLTRYIDKICRRQGGTTFLTLSIRGQEHSIPVEIIRYMESRDHMVTIYMDGEDLIVYEKLDSLIKKLPAVFVRCHKSYVVNMTRICRLDPDRVQLEDGAFVPVSQSNRIHMRTAFFEYIGEKTV
ncbi:MAG: LytTR family DNA-binding domain-containing protein [Lachnospiraceae bacterium]|nr:LytTR family DNA-binding domain-containing protein [Lachnospiraceae bacterium]